MGEVSVHLIVNLRAIRIIRLAAPLSLTKAEANS